jgi:putative transposase
MASPVGLVNTVTADPATVASQVDKLKNRYGIEKLAWVGDRGMLTQARIDTVLRPAGLDWVSSMILLCVRWYVAYSLSLRDLEEMMAERGFEVGHSSVHRWVIKLVPLFEKAFRKHKRPVGGSWRMERPTSRSRANGNSCTAQWTGTATPCFLLRARRDKVAARRYFENAIDRSGEPEVITIDKSGANLAALEAINAERQTPIRIRQNKCLNNVVEQDHRAIKRIIRPMMGFKDFRCARIILSGIEIVHMIRKGQLIDDGSAQTFADRFYSLVM